MPTNLTPELLQDISVQVVAKFMSKQASLSEAIADKAKSMELNPEQIKRVIESSNTIAYLRQLEDAKDRSFEFPVAEYHDVMGRMVLPDSSPTVDSTVAPLAPPLGEKVEVTKTAGIKTNPLNEKAPVSQIDLNAPEEEQQKIAMLIKETLRAKQTLQKMAEEGHMISLRLEQLSARVQKDPAGFEKLAHVAAEENLGSLSVLCGFEKTAETGSVFLSSELKDVMSLNSLFKEAKDLLTKQSELEVFVSRATNILIEKKAFSPLGGAAEMLGKGIGKFFSKGIVNPLAKSVKGIVAGVAGLTAGKTIGQRIERSSDLGAAALAGAGTSHENPVWKSIHG